MLLKNKTKGKHKNRRSKNKSKHKRNKYAGCLTLNRQLSSNQVSMMTLRVHGVYQPQKYRKSCFSVLKHSQSDRVVLKVNVSLQSQAVSLKSQPNVRVLTSEGNNTTRIPHYPHRDCSTVKDESQAMYSDSGCTCNVIADKKYL